MDDQTNATPGAAAERLRLFIAVPLPEEIRRQVGQLCQNMQKGIQFTPCRPTWSATETMHLTLVFLGPKSPEQVEPIARAMDRVTANFGPLRIEIKRLGVFPNWRNPRVLWAGIRERSHQIEELHRRLERAMASFGYEPEPREYSPHLTLARFKSLKGTSAIEGIVNSHQAFKFGPFDAPEIILYKSVLHPGGARHTALHHAQFGQATVQAAEERE